MVGPGFSDAPSVGAMRLVVDAFKAHGVTLHIDPQHTAIPARAVIVPDWGSYAIEPGFDDPACTGPDAVRFSDLQARYFHPSSSHPWHYAVFGEHVFTDTAADANHCPATVETGGEPLPNTSGVGQVGFLDDPSTLGYDFVVAMGSLRDVGITPTDTTVAAIFMHELGHNLGLQHGGAPVAGNDYFDNFKPNYISVMNYDFQFGIPYAATPGSNVTTGYRVDYSDSQLPDLNEANLDEAVGLQDTAHPTDITYSCSDEFCSTRVPAFGPVDWNGNGNTTDINVQSDLNQNGILNIDNGFDDWAWIHARLNPPTVAHFFPTTVYPGQAIEICGVNLYSPATVIFGGGATATGSSNQPGPPPGTGSCGPSDFGYAVDVNVPAGAKSGPISVVTTEGRATSRQNLTVMP